MPASARYVSFMLLVLSAAGAAARGEVTVRETGHYVVDLANLIDARAETRLEGWMRELEQKTGAQVKILTVPTLDGEPMFDFSQRHAELWGLGQKGKDNGVLLTVAMKERKDRIHVGYGLEGVLPDIWCNALRQKIIIPAFKQGHFSDGLFQSAIAIANRIADSKKVRLSGLPKPRFGRRRGRPSGVRALGGLVPMILMMVVIGRSRRSRGGGRWGGGGLMTGIMLASMLGGRGSSWGGGGGFGGGFGGGSFGGGGGFGGGGAGGGGW